MAINYDITAVKGDTIRWSNFIYDIDGSTFDFRGCTLYMQVRLGGYNSAKLIAEYSHYVPTIENFVEPFGYTGGITSKSLGTAYFCLGSCYSNQLTTSRPYNYDVKVYSSTHRTYTTIVRGSIYVTPNSTNFINYTTGTYASQEVSPAKSATGYALWANHFAGDGMFSTSLESRYKWGSSDYVYLAVVPTIQISGNSYNGYRMPGVTNISDISSSMLTTIKSRLASIPSTRRCLMPYYYWPDCNIFTKEHQTYYRSKGDGTTYSGSTFMTPWTDVNLNDAKLSFKTLLQNLANDGITFDYLIDDKEEQGYYHLDGLNTYNYWGSYNFYGVPSDPNPNLAYTRPMPDARVISALVADSRFNSYVNPASGKTFAAEFLSNYKNLINDQAFSQTAERVLARVINVTGLTAYKSPTLWWQPWSGNVNTGGHTGGFTFFTCAVPAFNAALDSLMFGYYTKELFETPLSQVSGFENTKHIQYEIFPIDYQESAYLQKSNLDRILQSPVPSTWSGDAYYGLITNVVFSSWALPCSGAFPTAFQTRSGYVTSPTSLIETYGWCGYQITTYSNNTLVRYPEENPCEGGSFTKFYKELSFKTLVNLLMFLRGSLRSDSTFWQRFTPWIGDPYFGVWVYQNGSGKGYWYELMYHLCLHGAQLFNYFDSSYSTYKTNDIQIFLDEWRTQSSNSKARPCSNSTGDINSIVDRLVLADVFEGVLISGGKLLESGKYLWRITLPPKFIDERGRATLVRVGSDSDIPEFIDIDGSDVKNSCGAWILRSVSTPPEYTPVPR